MLKRLISDISNLFNRKNKKRILALLSTVLAVLILVFFIGFFAGNYINSSIMNSRSYYFAAETSMISNHGNKLVPTTNASQYKFFPGNAKYNELSVYGGELSDIEINVVNFFDDERISEAYDIEYKVRILKTNVNGVYLMKGDHVNAANSQIVYAGSSGDAESESQMLLPDILHHSNNGKVWDRWVLHIPRHEIAQYNDGTVISVVLESVAPYHETVVLNFRLYAFDPKLSYSVTENNFYYEMKISSVSDVGDITLHWPQGLSLDDTNPLTYNYSSGEFIPTPVYEETTSYGKGYYLKVNNGSDGYALHSGETVSIFFYKEPDTSTICNTTADVVPVGTIMTNPICPTVASAP